MSETNSAVLENPGTSLKVLVTVNMAELQRWLHDYGVEISDETLNLLTNEQSEILWDWMEKHPEDPAMDIDWFGLLPEFMEFREGTTVEHDGEKIQLIALKSEPVVLDAEVEAVSEPDVAGAEVVNKTADVLLVEENQRLRAHKKLIDDANEQVQLRTANRTAAESEVASAKAALKESQADLDRATAELSRVIMDMKTGQQQLPFDDVPRNSSTVDSSPMQTATINANTMIPWPISELGAKSIKKTIGAIAFDAAKAAEDPVGLSDKQLEKLEAAEWTTVELLEKAKREVRDWWLALAGKQDAAIVARVSSTLAAFRKVNPQ